MGAEKGLGRSPCRRQALLQEEGSSAVGLGPCTLSFSGISLFTYLLWSSLKVECELHQERTIFFCSFGVALAHHWRSLNLQLANIYSAPTMYQAP